MLILCSALSLLDQGDLGWGSENFHKMGRVKISLIKQFIDINVNVLISDIDTAWLQNPLPYFNRFPEAHILTSSGEHLWKYLCVAVLPLAHNNHIGHNHQLNVNADQLKETIPDDGLELWPNAGASFNIGIMLFRPESKEFVGEREQGMVLRAQTVLDW